MQNTPVAAYDWTPKSTMYDWEAIEAFTPREYRVARGQGIGVLIIDAMDVYIKFVHDEKAMKHNIHPVAYTKWRHRNGDEKAKNLLDADVYLGYDILYLSGSKVETRTDIHMTRLQEHELEGKVFIGGLDKGLENYKPAVRHHRHSSRSRSPSHAKDRGRSRSRSPSC